MNYIENCAVIVIRDVILHPYDHNCCSLPPPSLLSHCSCNCKASGGHCLCCCLLHCKSVTTCDSLHSGKGVGQTQKL
jgi:hypothetical protein